MTNVEASEVLEQWIAKNSPCNGLEQALLRAVTALRHQPEPQKLTLADLLEATANATYPEPVALQCEDCRFENLVNKHTCARCQSTNLRPIYTTSEVKP